MFVIITDGEENSSRRFSSDKVKAMIEHETEKHSWEFVFLGANIDAVETAGRFGIAPDRAVDYVPDGQGTQLNFRMMSEAVADFRKTCALPQMPLNAIRGDHQKRGKRR